MLHSLVKELASLSNNCLYRITFLGGSVIRLQQDLFRKPPKQDFSFIYFIFIISLSEQVNTCISFNLQSSSVQFSLLPESNVQSNGFQTICYP